MDEGKAPEGILLSEGILEVDGWEKVCYFLQLYHHQQTAHAQVNNLPPMLMQVAVNSRVTNAKPAHKSREGRKKNFSKRLGE